MEFPYRSGEEGYQHQHQHHHHHHPHPHIRQEDEIRGYEFEERYPPVASVYEPSPHAPGPAYAHTSHHAPAAYAHASQPPGPYGTHTSAGPYYSHPHEPPFVEALPAHHEQSPHLVSKSPQGQLVRVFCKKNQSFNLAVEHNTLIMKPADTQDEAQQWIKDDSYGMRVKDNYGKSAFSLVNKKTQMILKHAKEKGQQVLLTNYRPDIRDDDILWTESQDFGEGFCTVRCASDTLLNLTVFEGVKAVRNGSPLVLDTWHKGDHQLWKLFPL